MMIKYVVSIEMVSLNRPTNTSDTQSISMALNIFTVSVAIWVGMGLECDNRITLRDRIIMKFAHLLYVSKMSMSISCSYLKS